MKNSGNTRNMRGNNTVEYMLPIILAGLVVIIGILTLSDNGLLSNFFARSVDGQVAGSKIVINSKSNSQLASNSWRGQAKPPQVIPSTPSLPILNCNAKDCTLDFGTFTIEGLPSELVYDLDKGFAPGFLGGTPKMPIKICSADCQFCAIDTGEDLVYPTGVNTGGCVFTYTLYTLPQRQNPV